MAPRILFIVPADYDSLKKKGVADMILERDENGFFEKVITVHPFVKKTNVIRLSNIHTLYEIGYEFFGSNFFSKILAKLLLPVYSIALLFIIVYVSKTNRVDMIRSTDPFLCGGLALITSKMMRIPYCVSIHADYTKRYELNSIKNIHGLKLPQKALCFITKLVLSRADLIMPIRESLIDWSVKNGAQRKKVSIIPHGIDFSDFKENKDIDIFNILKIPRNKKIVSFVGRLSKENYVYDLIEFVRNVSEKRDDFLLVIAGDGEEKESLMNIIKGDSSLSNHIRILGFQPREVCFHLRESSAVSLCLMGGFSLIEACAAASPVISYDVEWHHELIKNGVSGILIKEHDTKKVAEAVCFLLDNQKSSKEMGDNAKKIALERHDIANTSNIKRTCYEKILFSKRKYNNFYPQKNPAFEIKLDNKWYTDWHFCQLKDRASAGVILKRWKNFEKVLNLWLKDVKSSCKNRQVNMLDAGCGDGVNLMFFASFIKRANLGAVLFGTDYNLLRLKRAKDKFPDVQLVNSLINNSPFQDNYFDVVLLNHVLEHVHDDDATLNDLSRIIKDSGILLLCVPNEGCFMANIRNKFFQKDILTTTDHVNFYKESSLRERVKKSNFEVLFLFKEGFFFPHLRISRFFNLVYGGNVITNALHFLFPSQSTELFFVLRNHCTKYHDK